MVRPTTTLRKMQTKRREKREKRRVKCKLNLLQRCLLFGSVSLWMEKKRNSQNRRKIKLEKKKGMTNEGAANCWMLRSGSAQREAATSVKRCGGMISVLSVAPFQTTTTTKKHARQGYFFIFSPALSYLCVPVQYDECKLHQVAIIE